MCNEGTGPITRPARHSLTCSLAFIRASMQIHSCMQCRPQPAGESHARGPQGAWEPSGDAGAGAGHNSVRSSEEVVSNDMAYQTREHSSRPVPTCFNPVSASFTLPSITSAHAFPPSACACECACSCVLKHPYKSIVLAHAQTGAVASSPSMPCRPLPPIPGVHSRGTVCWAEGVAPVCCPALRAGPVLPELPRSWLHLCMCSRVGVRLAVGVLHRNTVVFQ